MRKPGFIGLMLCYAVAHLIFYFGGKMKVQQQSNYADELQIINAAIQAKWDTSKINVVSNEIAQLSEAELEAKGICVLRPFIPDTIDISSTDAFPENIRNIEIFSSSNVRLAKDSIPKNMRHIDIVSTYTPDSTFVEKVMVAPEEKLYQEDVSDAAPMSTYEKWEMKRNAIAFGIIAALVISFFFRKEIFGQKKQGKYDFIADDEWPDKT